MKIQDLKVGDHYKINHRTVKGIIEITDISGFGDAYFKFIETNLNTATHSEDTLYVTSDSFSHLSSLSDCCFIKISFLTLV